MTDTPSPDDVSDAVLSDEERKVPCECCDGEGAIMLPDAGAGPGERVCLACDGWGWREP